MIKQSISNYFLLFLTLTCFLIPFSWSTTPWLTSLQTTVLLPLCKGIGSLFGIDYALDDLSSDSVLFTLIFVVTFFISLFIFIGLIFFSKKEDFQYKWMGATLLFFLSLVLFKYGLDKVFKHQFFMPEPNTLNTRLGQLDKDILFWSTIGSSYLYNLVTGLTEIIASLMILSLKFRRKGLMFSFFIVAHIVLLNFAFDISVKFFSLFLLTINGFLLLNFQVISDFKFSFFKPNRKVYYMNSVLGLFFLFEGLYPYVSTGNFNDDLAPRPAIHGSYLLEEPKEYYDQICIHRDNYMILMQGGRVQLTMKMKQKKLDKEFDLIGPNNEKATLTINSIKRDHFNFIIESNFKVLSSHSVVFKENLLNYPLLVDQFHLTID